MSKERVVASFQRIFLSPGFGGDSASVLTNSNNQEKWEVLDGTSVLQRQL